MKALIESKLVSKYDYLTLGQVKKKYDAKGLPAPTKIFGTVDKPADGGASFRKAMKDKNSIAYKSIHAGNRVHKALETGEINPKDELTRLSVEEFSKNILPEIDEVWGMESGVYHPAGYVGKFDAVGVLRGRDTLWDYKKVNKRKTPSQMKKYFMQSMAYTQAHNWMYESNIEQVAILQIYGKTADDIGSEITVLNKDEMANALTSFMDYVSRYKVINEQNIQQSKIKTGN